MRKLIVLAMSVFSPVWCFGGTHIMQGDPAVISSTTITGSLSLYGSLTMDTAYPTLGKIQDLSGNMMLTNNQSGSICAGSICNLNNNSVFGYAIRSAGTANNGIAIGYNSLLGSGDTIIGYNVAPSLSGSNLTNSTLIGSGGFNAGSTPGVWNYVTSIGAETTGPASSSGVGVTLLGAKTGVTAVSGGIGNATAIGYQAIATSSNSIVLGSTDPYTNVCIGCNSTTYGLDVSHPRGANVTYGLAVGTITAGTIDTGQGSNELYGMDQGVKTTDAPVFSSVFAQNSADPLFAAVDQTNNVTSILVSIDDLGFTGTISDHPFVMASNGTPMIYIGPSTDPYIGIGTTSPLPNTSIASPVNFEGVAPSTSSCGTNASVLGNNNMGKIIIGSGSPTSCTLTFATAFTNAPACICNNETNFFFCKAVGSAASLIITSTTSIASNTISYQCAGRD